jgi:hypothetical protein
MSLIIKKNVMKIYKLYSFIVLFSILFGCKDGIELDVKSVPKYTAEILTPNNPLTGKPHTEQELKDIDYDPTQALFVEKGKEFTIQIKLLKQAKVNLILSEDKKVALVVNSNMATLTTTVDKLGIAEGQSLTALFEIEYNDGAKEYHKYGIRHYVYRPRALYFYSKAGGITTLKSEDKSNSNSISPNGKLENEFLENGQLVKILDPDNLISHIEKGSFTVSVWTNIKEISSDPAVISIQDWASSSNAGFGIYAKSSAYRVVVTGDQRSASKTDMSFSVSHDSQWHHIALVVDRDSKKIELYFDGVSKVVKDMPDGLNIKGYGTLHIGQDGTGNYGAKFTGKTSSAAIYDYALTLNEINAIKR